MATIESRPILDTIKEALVLLDLIDAEFRSDPMSTRCFDTRIVERVHRCVQASENLGIARAMLGPEKGDGHDATR